ncbi:MAG: YegP family protein [Acidimicrobiales bacterium]
MAGKFELYTDAGGKFRFRLRASNGQIIASSEAYNSKASALNGIESVKKNAPDAPTPSVGSNAGGASRARPGR